jgi:hypothetical protein
MGNDGVLRWSSLLLACPWNHSMTRPPVAAAFADDTARHSSEQTIKLLCRLCCYEQGRNGHTHW